MSEVNVEVDTEMPEINSNPSAQSPVMSIGGWQILGVKTRIDSFTQDALRNDIKALVAQGHKKIALDLRSNRFMSVQSILDCVQTARELAAAGGCLALIGPFEKTTRHFLVYGTLDQIWVVRSEMELEGPPRSFPISAERGL